MWNKEGTKQSIGLLDLKDTIFVMDGTPQL